MARLIAQMVRNSGPRLRPTIRTSDRPQGDEWVDVRARPVHAAAFQARLNHQLVGAFNAPAADRKALSLEYGVLALVQPLGQVVQRGVARFASRGWIGGLLDRQVCQRDQRFGGPMLMVFERVGLLM